MTTLLPGSRAAEVLEAVEVERDNTGQVTVKVRELSLQAVVTGERRVVRELGDSPADLVSRSRAAGSLVKAGLETDQALRVVGLT